MRTPSNLDPLQTGAFRRWRTILFLSLGIWAAAAAVLLVSATHTGTTNRIEAILPPILICSCCWVVIAFEPQFAVGFVVTTMALTAVASAFLAPIVLMLLVGWGGSARSQADSFVLYSIVSCWLTNALALAVALRYSKILWSSIPQEKIVYGCLAPFLLVLLLRRFH